MGQLYFKQFLSGVDFGTANPHAEGMANFVYAIGDTDTKECFIVDPAWDVQGLIDLVEADGMTLKGALLTHYHADHCGGCVFHLEIEGIVELLNLKDIPIYVQKSEQEWVLKSTQVAPSALVTVDPGQILTLGQTEVQCIHTPGHTPGSQCFHLNGRLLAGDTLFLQGCGRTDLPGGNPEDLYRSLNTTLLKMPDQTVLFPGHNYTGAKSAPFSVVKQDNKVLRMGSLNQFLNMFS